MKGLFVATLLFVLSGLATAQSDMAFQHGRPHALMAPPKTRFGSDTEAGTTGVQSTRRLPYQGGPIMETSIVYLIFWEPPTVQNGASAAVPANFNNTMYQYFIDVNASTLGQVQTQYWMRRSDGTQAHVQNKVTYGGYYIDRTPYPTGACLHSTTGWNCITDAWIQYEVKRAMIAKQWSTGPNKIFMVYTGNREGSCYYTYANGQCASGTEVFKNYCAYHSFFLWGNQAVIYANMPYLFTVCDAVPVSPHGNKIIDAELSVTSHEHFEAITDPYPAQGYYGWMDLGEKGGENGDKCAWNFGSYGSWGNQVMNGHYYILQQEFSDLDYDAGRSPCVQRLN
jgi:hypothetical protein